MFEIYQDFPNFTINWGLVEDEQSEINLTCASYGDWLPLSVPRYLTNYTNFINSNFLSGFVTI